MSKPGPLKGLVVIARNSSDHFKTTVPDGFDPRLEFEDDVLWRAFEILLGPPAQPDGADQDRIVHPTGVPRERGRLSPCMKGQGKRVMCRFGSRETRPSLMPLRRLARGLLRHGGAGNRRNDEPAQPSHVEPNRTNVGSGT